MQTRFIDSGFIRRFIITGNFFMQPRFPAGLFCQGMDLKKNKKENSCPAFNRYKNVRRKIFFIRAGGGSKVIGISLIYTECPRT